MVLGSGSHSSNAEPKIQNPKLKTQNLEPNRAVRAFSLLEVIAAIAIFAIGMVAVLGLYAPVTNSVAAVGDAEAAARVADAVRARVQALPFDAALLLVQEVADVRAKDGAGNYNPNDGTKYPAVIFGRRDGEVGIYGANQGRGAWYDSGRVTMPDGDKYFEIDLVRSDALTPKTGDAVAAFVAYTMRVRWPAFLPTANPATAVQIGAAPGGGGAVPYDHGRKQVLFFTGSVLR